MEPLIADLSAPLTELRVFSAIVFVGFWAQECAARPGDWDQQIEIDSFTYTHAASSATRSPWHVNAYSCDDETVEGGPEVLYWVRIDELGRLTARVDGDTNVVDIDIHLLTSKKVSSDRADDCLARSNREISENVNVGDCFLVVDTYQGDQFSGSYALIVDFEPSDGWYRRPLAQGVELQTRSYASLFGGPQTGSVLHVDLTEPGVEMKPIVGSTCATTSEFAEASGAVAAVNGGFFDGACHSVSLIKADGRLVARNARGRAAFGMDQSGVPSIQ